MKISEEHVVAAEVEGVDTGGADEMSENMSSPL